MPNIIKLEKESIDKDLEQAQFLIWAYLDSDTLSELDPDEREPLEKAIKAIKTARTLVRYRSRMFPEST